MPDELQREEAATSNETSPSEAPRSAEEILHVRLDGLEQLVERLLDHPEKLNDRFDKLLSIVEILAESHAEVRSDFLKLQKEYEEFRKRTEEALRDLADNQKGGDERFDTILQIVDDLIRRRPSEPPPSI